MKRSRSSIPLSAVQVRTLGAVLSTLMAKSEATSESRFRASLAVISSRIRSSRASAEGITGWGRGLDLGVVLLRPARADQDEAGENQDLQEAEGVQLAYSCLAKDQLLALWLAFGDLVEVTVVVEE